MWISRESSFRPAKIDTSSRSVVIEEAIRRFLVQDGLAARDLFDLAGLERLGAINPEAFSLSERVRGSRPQTQEFGDQLVPREWLRELGNQVAEVGDPGQMLEEVRDAVARALST